MLKKLNIKNIKLNPVYSIFKMFDKKDRIRAIISLILIFLAAMADLFNPFIFAIILTQISDAYVKGPITIDSIDWWMFGVMAACAVIALITNGIAVTLNMKTATNMTHRLRNTIFSKVQYLSSKEFDEMSGSSIITRTTIEVTLVEQVLINYNPMLFKAISLITGAFIMSIIQLVIFSINSPDSSNIWYMALAYLFIFLLIFIVFYIDKKGMIPFTKTRSIIDSTNNVIQENIVGNKFIRMFNLENEQTKTYEKKNKLLLNYSIKSEKIFSWLAPTAYFFLNIGIIVIFTVGGSYAWFSTENGALIGLLVSFIQYMLTILFGMSLVSLFGYIYSKGSVGAERIMEILNIENSVNESDSPKEITNGSIVFNNASFRFNTKTKILNKNILSNINLKIKEGGSLGVIGQTGSGKSSFINLIARLYDVTEGEVLISGINVKEISFKSLYDSISVSLQEKVILSGTYRSNILIGNPNATEKEIIEAAKNAEAWEFISNKENKLDGIVEERGNNLSGGQKQRLSIARALIKKPKILIIDDSTSALDMITESKILKNLFTNFPNTTIIIVSQKIKSIQDCDNIIVLDNGKISQQGTHKQLIKSKNDVYYKIYDSQKVSLEG